jgi:hypothetical protein
VRRFERCGTDTEIKWYQFYVYVTWEQSQTKAKTLKSLQIAIVTMKPFAILTIYNVTDLINALQGNSSVNTVQHAIIDEAVFFCRPRRAAVEQRGYANRF